MERMYEVIMIELEVAQEDYSEAAARVTRLIAIANTIRAILDS